jgi:molecular chaperone DnaK (HSP70)
VGEAYYLLSWEQDKRKIQEHLALMEKWIHEFKLDEELREAKKDKLLEKIQALQNQLKNKLSKK